LAWDLPYKINPVKLIPMLIKLDTSVFRLSRHKAETVKKSVTPLTRDQWITADRIVIAAMFIATIVGAILF
jgi:hypothetical protein